MITTFIHVTWYWTYFRDAPALCVALWGANSGKQSLIPHTSSEGSVLDGGQQGYWSSPTSLLLPLPPPTNFIFFSPQALKEDKNQTHNISDTSTGSLSLWVLVKRGTSAPPVGFLSLQVLPICSLSPFLIWMLFALWLCFIAARQNGSGSAESTSEKFPERERVFWPWIHSRAGTSTSAA